MILYLYYLATLDFLCRLPQRLLIGPDEEDGGTWQPIQPDGGQPVQII